jgi:glutamyl-tRNA synthetase
MLLAALPGLKERAKTLVELADSAQYLFATRPLALDEKAAQILDADARATIAALLPALEALDDWTVETTEGAVRAYAESAGLKLGKVAQPLRAALTGRSTSPGVFDVIAVLGREESLARLRDQSA